MFSVEQGAVRTQWFPIDRVVGASTLYVGQLVKADMSVAINGVAPLAAGAAGAADTTGKNVLFGVVIGTNDQVPTYDATYGQYIASVQTPAQQKARKFFGVEGMWAKNDPQPFVKVAVIDAHTVLRGNIYNATVGVAPTVVTASAVNATAGLGMTTGSIDVATIAQLCTTYCRSGANRGLYRVNLSASATAHTFTTYWPYTLAIGDTFVTVPLKPFGTSYAQITTTAGYIGMGFNCAATPATDYFLIDVLELDLREAGKETVLFRFAPCHFDMVRA